MPNGRRGDNPITDIIAWGLEPFSPEVNDLIREVAAFTHDFGEYDAFEPVGQLLWDVESGEKPERELRDALVALRDQLRREHHDRTWPPETIKIALPWDEAVVLYDLLDRYHGDAKPELMTDRADWQTLVSLFARLERGGHGRYLITARCSPKRGISSTEPTKLPLRNRMQASALAAAETRAARCRNSG